MTILKVMFLRIIYLQFNVDINTVLQEKKNTNCISSFNVSNNKEVQVSMSQSQL